MCIKNYKNLQREQESEKYMQIPYDRSSLRASNSESGRGSGFDLKAVEGAAGWVVFGEEERKPENWKRKSVEWKKVQRSFQKTFWILDFGY